MGWRIVERRLGRAGGPRQRARTQRRWDARYGVERWAVGYVLDGAFCLREHALETVYLASYAAFFGDHPEVLEALTELAGELHNPHAAHTGGVDLQTWAIRRIIADRGLTLQGRERVDIGSFGDRSHAISDRLNPSQIPCVAEPRLSLERFWQKRKVLAVWEDD